MYICNGCGLSGLNCDCGYDIKQFEEEDDYLEDEDDDDEDDYENNCPMCAAKLDTEGMCTVCFWSL